MADYYVDLSLGGSSGAGTVPSPWSWDSFQAAGAPGAGDIVHLRDTQAGELAYLNTGPVGAVGNHITFQQWAAQAAASFDAITFDNAVVWIGYLTFDTLTFNGRAMTTINLPTIHLDGCSSLTFDTCTVISGAVTSAAGGEFAPYYPNNQHNILGTDAALATNDITLTGCTITGGGGAITNAGGDRWTITDNIITAFSNNGVGISAGFGDDSLIDGNTINSYRSSKGAFIVSGSWDVEPAEGAAITQLVTGWTGIYHRLNASSQMEFFADASATYPTEGLIGAQNWETAGSANVWTSTTTTEENQHSDGVSLEGTCTDVVISNNIVFDTGRQAQGIKVGPNGGDPVDTLIFNNILWLDAGDGNNYLLYNEGGTGTVIANNISDGSTISNSRGMRMFGSATNVTVFNNILSGITEQVAFNHDYNIYVNDNLGTETVNSIADLGGAPNEVRLTLATAHLIKVGDSILLSGMSVGGYDGRHIVTAIGALTFDIEHADLGTATGTVNTHGANEAPAGTHSWADLVTSQATRDYTLAALSPAIDFGIDTFNSKDAPLTNIDGDVGTDETVDIGAYGERFLAAIPSGGKTVRGFGGRFSGSNRFSPAFNRFDNTGRF